MARTGAFLGRGDKLTLPSSVRLLIGQIGMSGTVPGLSHVAVGIILLLDPPTKPARGTVPPHSADRETEASWGY